METVNLNNLQQNIEYTFRSQELLKRSLTHSSAESENNQRLEFLGDAVLELIISEYLYHSYEKYEEGMLTKVRAAIVTESALAQAAKTLSLGEYIIFGKGEQKTHGKDKPSILADAFESFLGAMYLDGGYDLAKKTAMKLLGDIIEDALNGKGFTNYKSLLQEHFNKNGVLDIKYVICKEEGPQHNKTFYVKLYKGKKEISEGSGKSKKQAEQDAAKTAMQNLGLNV